ncbi:MAG: RDD family protein [Pyrinomonadaceae bacterium]
MTCPVCKRELAPTISICYACGTMVHDSVREELSTKIGRGSKPLEIGFAKASEPLLRPPAKEPAREPELVHAVPNPSAGIPKRQPKADPTERINRHTSQTLVEFQNKNSQIPDWRLQLQNAVRQRKSEPEPAPVLIPGLHTHLVTNSANALKPQPAPEPEPTSHTNPRVANALKRIEDSRRRFSSGATAENETAAPAAAKSYPFDVVTRSEVPAIPNSAVRPATVNSLPKPRLVSTASSTLEKTGFDTNKLPPISDVGVTAAEVISTMIEIPATEVVEDVIVNEEAADTRSDDLRLETVTEEYLEEIDDLAPLSARFTAGLFDAIIAGFATGILLSPLMMMGGEWLSVAGLLTIFAAFGIVMFLYLTVAIGLRGRTIGMKLFSLEVIDIEENEYPTYHQAAVSSAVYLLSLPLFGIGFVPAFFNEERRAAHDLISGTLLVREM